MNKFIYEFSRYNMNCIPGGTKEACLIVREYLHNCKLDKENISLSECGVSSTEFLGAVEVLLSSTWENKNNDYVPESYECESDCSRNNGDTFCPGEFCIGKHRVLAKRPCPYYIDSGNI